MYVWHLPDDFQPAGQCRNVRKVKWGFLHGSDVKEPTYKTGDLGSILRLGIAPEGEQVYHSLARQ